MYSYLYVLHTHNYIINHSINQNICIIVYKKQRYISVSTLFFLLIVTLALLVNKTTTKIMVKQYIVFKEIVKISCYHDFNLVLTTVYEE